MCVTCIYRQIIMHIIICVYECVCVCVSMSLSKLYRYIISFHSWADDPLTQYYIAELSKCPIGRKLILTYIETLIRYANYFIIGRLQTRTYILSLLYLQYKYAHKFVYLFNETYIYISIWYVYLRTLDVGM